MWNRGGEELLLSLSPEGVHVLREQWSRLHELVRRQLEDCSTDPLAELTGMPVPTGSIDRRLAHLVDYWCGAEACGPVRQVREGWLLHGLERALSRVLDTLPRHGGVVALPGRGHPVTVEWGSMLETLHVMLDNCAAEAEHHRLIQRWLRLVLDTLDQHERPISTRAAQCGRDRSAA